MSTNKKPARGSQNLKSSGMLTKINKHFFPSKKTVEQRFLYLRNEITVESCANIIAEIIDANMPEYVSDEKNGLILLDPPDVINLLITSTGGDMSGAHSLIAVMRGSAIPIRTIAIGEASSAALCILMAGHQRVATDYTSLMSHQFLTETGGSYDDIKTMVAEFDMYYKKMTRLYLECTGLDERFIKSKLLSSKDHYFAPEKALEYNMIDLVSDLA